MEFLLIILAYVFVMPGSLLLGAFTNDDNTGGIPAMMTSIVGSFVLTMLLYAGLIVGYIYWTG